MIKITFRKWTLVATLITMATIITAQANILDDLQALYPKLSRNQVIEKIETSKNTFQFFRAFVPLYYKVVKEDSQKLPSSIQELIESSAGWCVGDAHIENFGAVFVQSNSEPRFSINDYDDAGPCPVAADVLRFFVGLFLNDHSTDLGEILENYGDGLKDKDHDWRGPVQDLLDEAKDKGKEVKPSAVDEKSKRLIRNDMMSEVNRAAWEAFERGLKGVFPEANLKLLDAAKQERDHGGSGGLDRYEFLIEGLTQNLMHLEMKELDRPAIFLMATQEIPEQKKRMETALKMEIGENYPRFYQVMDFQGESYLLRPKWHGLVKVSIDDYSDKELFKVIKDEAFALGKIHALSLKQKQKHNSIFETTKTKDWEDATNFVQKRIKELYCEAKDGLPKER